MQVMAVTEFGTPQTKSDTFRPTKPDELARRRVAQVALCGDNPKLLEGISAAIEGQEIMACEVRAWVDTLEEVPDVVSDMELDVVVVLPQHASDLGKALPEVIGNTQSSVPFVIAKEALDDTVDVTLVQQEAESHDSFYRHPVLQASISHLLGQEPRVSPADQLHQAAADFRLWAEPLAS